jgi:thiol-disulfide isomerase/thioredoxin
MKAHHDHHIARLSLLCCVTTLAALVGGCAGSPAIQPSPAVAQLAQEFPLASAPASLRELVAGRAAVVDLWATWCSTCERERPKLERLAAVYEGSAVVVTSVAVGEDENTVSRYARDYGLRLPIHLDSQLRLANALGATELPTVVVVDEQGKIVYRSHRIDRTTLEHVRSVANGLRQ